MKQLTLMVFLCVLATAGATPAAQDKPFTSKLFGFSASFTHVPKETNGDRLVTIEGREMMIKATNFVSWDKRRLSYVVGAFSFPFNIQTESEVEAYLKSSQAAYLKRAGGRLLRSTRAKVLDRPGLKFVFEFDHDGQTYVSNIQSVVVGTRAFNIEVIGPKGTDTSAERAEFFKSFKLIW